MYFPLFLLPFQIVIPVDFDYSPCWWTPVWSCRLCHTTEAGEKYYLTIYHAALCCLPVSNSICMSRWWIVSKGLKISSNFLFGPVAASLYFFYLQHQYIIPRESLQHRHKILLFLLVEQFCNFRLRSPFISETVQPLVLMER